jgi:hypothetical protein
MARKPTFRQLLVSILALWRDRSHKEIGAAAGIPQKQVSFYLRRGEIADEALEKLLAALECSPAAVHIVMACLESLAALEEENGLTAEEKAAVADAVLRASPLIRDGLMEAARHSRVVKAEAILDDHAIAYDRQRAVEQFKRLEGLLQGARWVEDGR